MSKFKSAVFSKGDDHPNKMTTTHCRPTIPML